jgi:CRP/FNR family transcriptional regulator, cyclic AMP receptor protein
MTKDILPADEPSTFMPFKSGIGLYDPAVAKAFFKAFGKKETIVADTIVFAENERSRKQTIFEKRLDKALTTKIDKDLFRSRNIHRMYLLTKGEVALTAGDRLLDRVMPGDVFGEMAVISEIPDMDQEASRSATAKAVVDCSGYSLDGLEAQAGLAKQPEFALMLMSVMFERLRFLAARLAARADEPGHRSLRSEPIFDPGTLAALQEKLDHAPVVRFREGAKIMKEGSPGTAMYVVLEGKVAVAIGRKIVEKLEVGGVFGEMALVDQRPRTAGAVAREDTALLAINRDALINLVKSEPGVGMAMMRAVAARLRYMNGLFG